MTNAPPFKLQNLFLGPFREMRRAGGHLGEVVAASEEPDRGCGKHICLHVDVRDREQQRKLSGPQVALGLARWQGLYKHAPTLSLCSASALPGTSQGPRETQASSLRPKKKMSQRSGSRAAIVEVTQVKQKRLCEEKKNKTKPSCIVCCAAFGPPIS